jgi:hypothetical protein
MGWVQYRTSCQIRRWTSGQRASVAWRKAMRYSSVTTGKWYSFILAFHPRIPLHLGFFQVSFARVEHQGILEWEHPKEPS